MIETLNIVTAGGNIGLSQEFNAGVVMVIWVIAVAIGVWQYGKSKGRIGQALMAFFGAGIIITAVTYPKLVAESIPAVIKMAWNQVMAWFGGPQI